MARKEKSIGALLADLSCENMVVRKRAILSLSKIGARRGGKIKKDIINIFIGMLYEDCNVINHDLKKYISKCMEQILKHNLNSESKR